MNKNNWEEKFAKADLYEREYGCDGANQDYCCGGCSYSYLDEDKVKKFISETLQQQREEMKKEILKIGEHFVKFGEKKGVEVIDMVLAVINPPQNGESKK